jgi:hypothetical protein
MSDPEIYCPKCEWRPQADSRWLCTRRMGGCGHVWNTFDTRGVCPRCNFSWEITACLSCKQFSLHESWYHYPIGHPDDAHEEVQELVDA